MLIEFVATFVLPIVGLSAALILYLGSARRWPVTLNKDEPCEK